MKRNLMSGLSIRKPSSFDALGDIIISGYEAQRREESFKTKSTFAPSSLGGYQGACPRYWKLAFDGADFEDKTDAYGIATMASGTDAHTRIQDALEKGGVLKERELEIRLEDPPVRGFVDAIITWQEQSVVCEIKTTNHEHFEFRKLNKTAMLPHLLQVLIYMKALDIPQGLLIYQNRNNLELVMVPVEWDDYNTRLFDYSMDWMREVYAAFEDKKLPNPAYRKDNQICASCPVQKTCVSLPFGVLKIAKMDLKTVEKAL